MRSFSLFFSVKMHMWYITLILQFSFRKKIYIYSYRLQKCGPLLGGKFGHWNSEDLDVSGANGHPFIRHGGLYHGYGCWYVVNYFQAWDNNYLFQCFCENWWWAMRLYDFTTSIYAHIFVIVCLLNMEVGCFMTHMTHECALFPLKTSHYKFTVVLSLVFLYSAW